MTAEANLSLAFQIIGAEAAKNKNDEIIGSLKKVGDSWSRVQGQISKSRSYMSAAVGFMGGSAFGMGSSQKAETSLGSIGEYVGFFATFALMDKLSGKLNKSVRIMNIQRRKFIKSLNYESGHLDYRLKEAMRMQKINSGRTFLSGRIGDMLYNIPGSGRFLPQRAWDSWKTGSFSPVVSRGLTPGMTMNFWRGGARPLAGFLGRRAIAASIGVVLRVGLGFIGRGLGVAIGSLAGPVGTVAGMVVLGVIADKVGSWLGQAGDWIWNKVLTPAYNGVVIASTWFKDMHAKYITKSNDISNQFSTKSLETPSLSKLRIEIDKLRSDLPYNMKTDGWDPSQIASQMEKLNNEIKKITEKVNWETQMIYEQFEFIGRR